MVELDLNTDPGSIVDTILTWAVKAQATDVHLSPLSEGFLVRARVDGLLQDVGSLDEKVFPKVVSRLKVLAEIDIAMKLRPQDGRFSRSLDDRSVDFRVSCIPTLHGESVVLRVLDRTSGLRTIDQLGFNRKETSEFRSLISNASGIILVTGPTGAGKTTTLYSALLELAVPERNVITIEEPIEYEIPRGVQTAVQPRRDISFASLLRSILRHDPDVIMVGEVRDPETAQVAVRAALTGHLVLSSLHTQRASEAVSALLNFGVKSYALAPALRGVVAQQLVRRICPDCRTSFEYGEEVLTDPDFSRILTPEQKASFSIGLGCESCFQTGYRGRQGIFEILHVNEKVRDCILHGETSTDIEQAAVESGMLTLRQKGFRAVLDGMTTVEEVVRAIHIE